MLHEKSMYKRKRYWAEIDLDAAKANFNYIKKLCKPGTKLCCVVKANAYGHGSACLANLYQKLGADWFAVSNIEEAVQLQNNKVTKPILILGYTPPECAGLLAQHNFSQTVYSREYGEKLNNCAINAGVKVRIHIKLDTGMGRIGFDCKHADRNGDLDSAAEICRMSGLEPEGVFTHFSCADEGEESDGAAYTEQQYRNFIRGVKYLENAGISFALKHCSNSAAICDFPDFQCNMVRAGIVLYGLQPSSAVGKCGGLKPVMSLRSVVSMVKDVEPGDRISYGGSYTATHKMRIATVPVGYADGFWRSNSSSGTYMIIHGKRANIVGRVCMDQLMLDVTDISNVKAGDNVTVMGQDGDESVSADLIAVNNRTVNYEIVCSVGERVPRLYFQKGKLVYVKDNIVLYENEQSYDSFDI